MRKPRADFSSAYLQTPGAAIRTSGAPGSVFLHIEPGARVALVGDELLKKHMFCDWLLGFTEVAGCRIWLEVEGMTVESAAERMKIASVLGRSPLLVGETVQENLLYRTTDVRKDDLYDAIDRFYGSTLRERTDPQNPLYDRAGKPIPTQMLTAREHVEIAQINVVLQRTPLVVIDLSSKLMDEALRQGFKLAPELEASGKTLIYLLPEEGASPVLAEAVAGCRFTALLHF